MLCVEGAAFCDVLFKKHPSLSQTQERWIGDEWEHGFEAFFNMTNQRPSPMYFRVNKHISFLFFHFLLVILFIYISNVIPLPSFPSTNPHPITHNPHFYEGASPPFHPLPPQGGVRERTEGAKVVCNPIGRTTISSNQIPRSSQGLNHQRKKEYVWRDP